MSTNRVAERGLDMDMKVRIDPRHEEGSRLLLRAIRELLDRLTADEGSSGGPGSAADEVARWGDEESLYFEATLPGSSSAEIDLNITGGKAFVRMII